MSGTINGTPGNDTISPGFVSEGVTGGTPGAGNDVINGNAGDDALFGGGGNDGLDGGEGSDSLNGGTGNDFFTASNGNDTIDGGDNIVRNTLSYTGFMLGPITITLTNVLSGTVAKPGGEIDIFTNVSDIRGTAAGDTFFGNATLVGLISARYRPGAGNDTVDGASSFNVGIDYTDALKAINVNLALNIASQDGFDGQDTLNNVRFVRASAFDDTITGSAFDESFGVQGGGNKRIDGAGGVDTYRWNGGTAVTVNLGSTTVGGVPAGTVVKTTGTDTVIGIENFVGGSGNDTITGSSADNLLSGESGFDTIDGAGGFDTLDVSQITTTTLAAGRAIVNLSAVAVTVDSITVQAGTVRDGFGFTDTLLSIEGVTGTLFDDVIHGSAVANRLAGGAGSDVLLGGNGDDTLAGGAGTNNLLGGAGDDAYLIASASDIATEVAGEGLDTAWVEATGWTLAAGIEILRLFGAGTQATGSIGDDIMVANAGAASLVAGGDGSDVLWGGPLAHRLNGDAGDDTIRGQDGPVTMAGGVGNDQFVVGHAAAVVLENLDEGEDTAWVAVSGWTNAAHVEIARLAAAGAVLLHGSEGAEQLVANGGAASTLNGMAGNDILWGSAFADELNGGEGNDIIYGQGGADTMIGGDGVDQFVVFSTAAVITETPTGGFEIVYMAGAGTLSIGDNIEQGRLLLDGTGLIGNDDLNLLVGNSSNLASFLDGRGGNDLIFGTTAGDTIVGNAGDDQLYGQGGADTYRYDAPGWGSDAIATFSSGSRIQFTASSGVTEFGQLSLIAAGGNTGISHANGTILVFGATLTAGDFLFG
jgi:Ca2+-binding RTX toxin-like protein